MQTYCPSCGRPSPAGGGFCPSCGALLSRLPDADAERIPERDLGMLIARTFEVYRDNLWPFVMISLIPQVINLAAAFTPSVLSLVLSVVAIFASILSFGAAIYAVAQAHMGHGVDVEVCYRQSLKRAANLIASLGVYLVAIIGAAVLSIIVIGIPLLVFLLVIWIFFGQAVMLEGDGPISALGRSRFLVRGNWWRVFGIGVVYVLTFIGLAILVGIPVGILGLFAETAAIMIGTLAIAFISPVMNIGLTLLYIDLRVRNEGYTLRTLADQLRRVSA